MTNEIIPKQRQLTSYQNFNKYPNIHTQEKYEKKNTIKKQHNL